MAVVVPPSGGLLYAKYQEVLTITADLAAITSTAHQVALQQALVKAQRELVDTLMAAGKLSPAGILTAGTYGT